LNDFWEIETLNLDFSYYFNNNRKINPFIRFSAGYGQTKTDKSKVLRTAVALGTRLHLTEVLFADLEVMGQNQDFYPPDESKFGRSTAYWTSITDYTAGFSFGFQF
jgi:hypothetical protein